MNELETGCLRLNSVSAVDVKKSFSSCHSFNTDFIHMFVVCKPPQSVFPPTFPSVEMKDLNLNLLRSVISQQVSFSMSLNKTIVGQLHYIDAYTYELN